MSYECEEDSVKSFDNTAINPLEELSVTLYHNGTSVGLWTNNESKCYKTICRDGNNDIWLNDFHESDNGLYALLYQRCIHGPKEKQKERTFLVTIPPLLSCKPLFSYVPIYGVSGNVTAILPEIGCGNPPVTLFGSVDPIKNIIYTWTVNLSCIEIVGDGRQLSAVEPINRTNGIHWSVTIIVLIFIVVTIHLLVHLTLPLEKIQNMIQNTWRQWRHGNARNVGNMDQTP